MFSLPLKGFDQPLRGFVLYSLFPLFCNIAFDVKSFLIRKLFGHAGISLNRFHEYAIINPQIVKNEHIHRSRNTGWYDRLQQGNGGATSWSSMDFL